MPTCAIAERGFALLEVMLCVALFALAGAAGMGAFAAVARNAGPASAARDAALMVAENTLARARAAAAYVPAGAGDPAGAAGRLDWALLPEAAFTAGALLTGPAVCGASTQALQLPVRVQFDGVRRLTVTVSYPRDPCRGGPAAAVTLSEQLPLPVYRPGQILRRAVAPPATM